MSAGVDVQRVIWEPNGVDCGTFTRQRSVALAKQHRGWDPDRLVVGAIGRLAPEKGFDRLVSNFAQLLDRGLDADLVVAGAGECEADLRRQIGATGHGANIRLLGFVSDVRSLYEGLDLLVLSSRREGLPNVVLEAMAMGVPVVATAIAGLPDLVDHDRTGGVLVPPDDDEALTAAIERLLASPQRRHGQLATVAQAKVAADFSLDPRTKRD